MDNNGNAAPEWAQQLMLQMQAQVVQAQAQAQQIERIERQIAAQLSGQNGSIETATPTPIQSYRGTPYTGAATLEGNIHTGGRRRDKLPDCPEFDGKKGDFPP